MSVIESTVAYIRDDYRSNRFRFALEVTAFTCSFVSAIMFAVTVPEPPIVLLYCIFVSGCTAAAVAAYSRRSFGLLLNYVALVAIDGAGLLKMLLFHS